MPQFHRFESAVQFILPGEEKEKKPTCHVGSKDVVCPTLTWGVRARLESRKDPSPARTVHGRGTGSLRLGGSLP